MPDVWNKIIPANYAKSIEFGIAQFPEPLIGPRTNGARTHDLWSPKQALVSKPRIILSCRPDIIVGGLLAC